MGLFTHLFNGFLDYAWFIVIVISFSTSIYGAFIRKNSNDYKISKIPRRNYRFTGSPERDLFVYAFFAVKVTPVKSLESRMSEQKKTSLSPSFSVSV